MIVCTRLVCNCLVPYLFYTMAGGFDFRDGTHPEVQRAKALLLQVQEKRCWAGINRYYDDRNVGAIAIHCT